MQDQYVREAAAVQHACIYVAFYLYTQQYEGMRKQNLGTPDTDNYITTTTAA